MHVYERGSIQDKPMLLFSKNLEHWALMLYMRGRVDSRSSDLTPIVRLQWYSNTPTSPVESLKLWSVKFLNGSVVSAMFQDVSTRLIHPQGSVSQCLSKTEWFVIVYHYFGPL